MPALRKPTKMDELAVFAKMVGPRPLPPHFGEIDVTAPFDVEKYFAMLRCVGANPLVGRICGQNNLERSYEHSRTPIQQRREATAHAWANAKDQDSSQIDFYIAGIVRTQPDGDFVHYLG